MRIGMVGLGRMGGGMSARLREHGIHVVGYDHDPDRSDVPSVAGLVAALGQEPRRIVWVMVPAGVATTDTIMELADHMGEGDLVVDGGNSRHSDSVQHGLRLAERRISFVDVGVSGGIWGHDEGYCLMAGGAPADIADLRPVLDALATPGGVAHVGPIGTGHLAKMVHNGVEYALMQAYAEGYEILSASELGVDVPAAFEVWRHGSVIRSWLLELLAPALAADPHLEAVRGWADDSGEGRWTVQEAVDLAVPAPTISAALFARFASRQADSPAMKVVAILRGAFGGHEVHR